MIKGGKGGGNTATGLNFEKEKDILSLLSKIDGYTVKNSIVFFEDKEVARSYRKYDLYRYLQSQGVDYKKYLSKRLIPDDAIYVIANNTLFIIEFKSQKGGGSVDEKLQTCDFKKKHYRKLMAPLNIEVEYIYILEGWFRKPAYKDSLGYILSVGCQYYFSDMMIPLQKLGLPIPR